MRWSTSLYILTLPILITAGIIVVEIFFLDCHVIKQDNMIKALGDYNDRSPSR